VKRKDKLICAGLAAWSLVVMSVLGYLAWYFWPREVKYRGQSLSYWQKAMSEEETRIEALEALEDAMANDKLAWNRIVAAETVLLQFPNEDLPRKILRQESTDCDPELRRACAIAFIRIQYANRDDLVALRSLLADENEKVARDASITFAVLDKDPIVFQSVMKELLEHERAEVQVRAQSLMESR
jgi:hypothetical protein